MYKAYDWAKAFGFGDCWIQWVDCSVLMVFLLTLLNGSTLKPFQLAHGILRDPLSPYLFITTI